MKTIPLTQGYEALVDDSDYDDVMQFKWFATVRYRKDGSIMAVYAGRKHCILYLHRYLLGLTDSHILCDHRDNNGLNNQRANLRVATNSQNQRNKRKSGGTASQYKGVDWVRSTGKWHARILLGSFDNERDAAQAYNKAAIAVFGEFACLNDIP